MLSEDTKVRLIDVVGDRFSDDAEMRNKYAPDIDHIDYFVPDAIVYPNSKEEIQSIVNICEISNTPIIPFGAGTSVEGQVSAPLGGICLQLSRMNKVVRFSEFDKDITVEAGITKNELNSYLSGKGLFFSVDPGVNATIGGMCSTSASGANTVKYGTIGENILNLGVVVSGGRYIKTGSRARKSAAGFDLARLFVGAEGTLGVITEATLKLNATPQSRVCVLAEFANLEGAVNTIVEVLRGCAPIAKAELLDEVAVQAMNNYSSLSLNVRPHVLLEIHGNTNTINFYQELVDQSLRESGVAAIAFLKGEGQDNRIWSARYSLGLAIKGYFPSKKLLWTDVCVPISELAECISDAKALLVDHCLDASIFGHVGDGNFHMGISASNAEEMRLAKYIHEVIVDIAHARGGTCTGEHGVGIGKIDFLYRERVSEIELMRGIKQSLDPKHIFNPSKLF